MTTDFIELIFYRIYCIVKIENKLNHDKGIQLISSKLLSKFIKFLK